MDIFLVFFILLPILLVVLIGIVAFRLWKKGKGWKLGIITTALIFSATVYDAIYPSDSFYERGFERVSGLTFPKSGVIKNKDSTFPDIHGDYASCALIEVSADDYQLLKRKLLASEKHSTGMLAPLCDGLSLKATPTSRYEVALEKDFDEKTSEASGWGILENSSLVYFYYWSS